MKSMITSNHNINIRNAILWTVLYFGILLLTTTIDIVFLRKNFKNNSAWLNLITMIIFSVFYFIQMSKINNYRINLFCGISIKNFFLAIGCAILFYFLLDKFLDPIFEKIFQVSETAYQESIKTLKASPLTTFLRVCMIAPVIEELLMRGFVLGGLKNNYSILVALLVSALLFSLLHFNMVQTLSAFICGIVLGVLYINTGSIFCCILAHFLYNAISYFTIIKS